MTALLGRPSALLVGAALALSALALAGAPRPEAALVAEGPVKPLGPNSWPMWGGTPARNLANTVEKGIPGDWSVEEGKQKNVKWAVPLGTFAYGGPAIAGGRIFVGTNNEKARDPKVEGDKGILLCLRETDGSFLWQIVHDKLPDPANNDVQEHGVASCPVIDGDRLYYVSNRCEVVCADVAGAGGGKGKVVWTLDMIKELKVYPCYLANSSPLVVDDLVFALTGNGTVPETDKLPSPQAPALVAVNKATGKLAWADSSPGKGVLAGQWSSPAAAKVDGSWQVIYGGGDGWIRGLDAKTGKLLWKFDGNPKAAEYKEGRGNRNYVVATPVVYDSKVYVPMGIDPDKGTGEGHLWCIDLTKKPTNPQLDLSPVKDNFDPKAAVNKDSGLVWHFGGVEARPGGGRPRPIFGRSVSTVAIHDDLVYAAEVGGYLHCVDAKTGEKYWTFDLKSGTWDSPFYVDGKVMIGNESSELFVLPAGKADPKGKATKIEMGDPMKVPPVANNGVLYVNTGTMLYAIAGK